MMGKRQLLEEFIMIEPLAVFLHHKRSAWDMVLLYYNIALLNISELPLVICHVTVFFVYRGQSK